MSDNLKYRISLIAESGLCLMVTEYTSDKDSAIFVFDTIRENCRGKLRCFIETKASGFVNMGDVHGV
jgi:hypothetical protein